MSVINMELSDFDAVLAPRQRDAHKGHFGHVLVLAGDIGMPGAARLVGEAALRAGAGLVTVATRPEHVAAISAGCPELMVYPVYHTTDLPDLINRATVIAIGSGLINSDWSQALFDAIILSDLPCICDAGALDKLIDQPLQRENWILTPHPGEAARMIGSSAKEINQDRIAAVETLQQIYGGTMVLKGKGTLIRGLDGQNYLCDAGNPGMGSAGMGDVLSGVIAGLLAQGLSCLQAATLGVMIHAHAGDRIAQSGERGLIASALFAAFPALLNPNR